MNLTRGEPHPGSLSQQSEATHAGEDLGRVFRWAAVAAMVLMIVGFYALGLHRLFTLEALRGWKDELTGLVRSNAAMAVLAYVAVYISAVALSFPGASILTAAGGLMFGAVAGTGLALISATAGATVLFLVAGTSLGEPLARRAGPRMRRLRRGFRDDGFAYLLFLRLIPLFPFWLVNLAAAVSGMRLGSYVVATALGIVPGTFVLAYFGEGLGAAIGGEAPGQWTEAMAGRFALLAVLVLVPVGVRKWRRRRGRNAEVRS